MNRRKVQVLKSWSPFFQAIRTGVKKHDLRDNKDRKFAVGDRLLLQEYDPFTGTYSGEECLVEVTYITGRETPCAFSSAVLDRDFVILSLHLVAYDKSGISHDTI
jgi:hypothetical protein